MGGNVDWRDTASVCIYDAAADTWATGPPLPSPRANCSASSIDGGILLQTEHVTFEYKNAMWAEVAGGGVGPYATCGSVLLG